MPGFDRKVTDAAARAREARLTTTGRHSGKPVTVTVWLTTDGDRLFVRSGGGLGRNWPRNLLKLPEASLRVGGLEFNVKARHITDPGEARGVAEVIRKKHGPNVRVSTPDEPLTPGEQATFELFPA
ncbi:MAG TPA: nitroreductase/quinone reductase family protein [Candidatus Dormibacteraeota bacterium]|nr:nitroreductase/quinone reductase family protein [Candidatus Dormibacteraeota bacterium]